VSDAPTTPSKRDRAKSTVAALLQSAPPPRREEPAPQPEEPAVDNPVLETGDRPATAVAVEPSDQPRPRRATRDATSRVRDRSLKAEASSPPSESSKIVQTRIPAALFERVRASKDSTGDTHETWFLDALDAVWDELGDVYRPAPARRTRVPVRQRRTRRPSNDPLVSYPLRLDDEERAVLEDCRAEFSPPSLADLVTTIVRLRLEQLEQAPPRGTKA
jgi:hypothetical protein